MQRSLDYEPLIGERIESYFRNYAHNFWLTSPHVGSTSLLAHLQKLLMRMMILRILLIGHPRLQAAFARRQQAEATAVNQRQAELHKTLEDATVEVFYSFYRSIEHNKTCVDVMSAAWEEVPNPERLHRQLKFLDVSRLETRRVVPDFVSRQ